MNRRSLLAVLACLAVALVVMGATRPPAAQRPLYRSPSALALAPDARTLWVADQTAGVVLKVDTAKGAVVGAIAVSEPRGLALSRDGRTLYVTSGNRDQVHKVDTVTRRIVASAATGRQPVGMALAPDGRKLYVCNQLSDDVRVYETAKLTRTARRPMVREPRYAALTPDGQTLVVANLLPLGSNMDEGLGAELSIVDLAGGKRDRILLSRGATDVGQVCLSPDGRYAYVSHILARWLVPPTQLERGWVSTNALTVVDVTERKRLNTVLLDDLDRGAANPWGLALTPSGKLLVSAHAGTHEVQVLDTAKLHKLIAEWPADSLTALEDDLTAVYRAGVRCRVPSGGLGPRIVAVTEDTAYVANYFSGTVTRLSLSPAAPAPAAGAPAESTFDLNTPKARVTKTIGLGRQPAMDKVRHGELLFHDARVCFQNWQSCVTCHPEGRTDALSWDLLNDGIGNPKSAKSLLLSGKTPPVMAHGVRANMGVAVAAGYKFILFHVPTEEELADTEAYIASLRPVRSPYRNPDGSLSAAAKRGKAVYERKDVACATCHPGPLFTDLKEYEVGSLGPFDKKGSFDTPTLVEVFRTGPYLHDGSAVTMREVLKERNQEDKHGKTSQLTEQELRDLEEYVLSL